jgi:hypothetical protein
MNGYGSEMNASPPLFWEAVGHKHGLMLHRKIMWRDLYSATGWADENQRYGDEICIGERRNFCSRARSQLRGICYCVCVRFWVKYVQR